MKRTAWAAGLGLAALATLAACSGRSGYTPLSNDPGDDDSGEPRVVRDASATDARAADAEPDATDVADSAPIDTHDAEVEAAAPAPVDDAGDGVPQ